MSSVSGLEILKAGEQAKIAHESCAIRKSRQGPRLLVSIRSAAEAERAMAGGVEILDVKEPSLGSLGMARIDEIVAISRSGNISDGSTPLSVALGEVVDWPAASSFPKLPGGITFAKLGLSQCARQPDWRSDWQRVRAEFNRRSCSRLNWVAVAYADTKEAASPSIAHVLDAAIETRCAGLLIDTWTKAEITLLDRIDATQLTEIAIACHASGMFFAIAGKLQLESLPVLARVPIDVIAIRSAACRGTDRTAELDSGRVAEFRNEMRYYF